MGRPGPVRIGVPGLYKKANEQVSGNKSVSSFSIVSASVPAPRFFSTLLNSLLTGSGILGLLATFTISRLAGTLAVMNCKLQNEIEPFFPNLLSVMVFITATGGKQGCHSHKNKILILSLCSAVRKMHRACCFLEGQWQGSWD